MIATRKRDELRYDISNGIESIQYRYKAVFQIYYGVRAWMFRPIVLDFDDLVGIDQDGFTSKIRQRNQLERHGQLFTENSLWFPINNGRPMGTVEPAAMSPTSTPTAREYVGRCGDASEDGRDEHNRELVMHALVHVIPFGFLVPEFGDL